MSLLNNKQFIAVGVVGAAGLWFARKQAAKAAQAINPVNQENVFYQGTNAVGSKLTGDKDFTLGGWIYDITHSGSEL